MEIVPSAEHNRMTGTLICAVGDAVLIETAPDGLTDGDISVYMANWRQLATAELTESMNAHLPVARVHGA